MKNDSSESANHSPLSAHHSSLNAPHSFPGWNHAFGAAMERLSVAVRMPARGQHAGAVHSRYRGRALEFADYRAYSSGDDPKLVDWRAYARLGRLYLKQYEEERARTITLLIDTSASMDWGEGNLHKGLYARRLAAALAWISTGQHEPVQCYLLREGAALPLRPVATRPGTVLTFRELAAVREWGQTILGQSIQSIAPLLIRGPTILLTDLLDPTWPVALSALAPSRDAVVLHLLAPDEWEPPLGEEVELVDAETAELRTTRLGPGELSSYQERLRAFLTQVRSHCHRLGIVHSTINTQTPLQETVLSQLPQAGVLAG